MKGSHGRLKPKHDMSRVSNPWVLGPLGTPEGPNDPEK